MLLDPVKNRKLQVFFHRPGQFEYYTEQDTMPNSFRIDFLTFKEDHESILTLKKSSYSSLHKPPDRPCQARYKVGSLWTIAGKEAPDYSWNDCLHKMFYSRRGCQDPWNFKPGLSLYAIPTTYATKALKKEPSRDTHTAQHHTTPQKIRLRAQQKAIVISPHCKNCQNDVGQGTIENARLLVWKVDCWKALVHCCTLSLFYLGAETSSMIIDQWSLIIDHRRNPNINNKDHLVGD